MMMMPNCKLNYHIKTVKIQYKHFSLNNKIFFIDDDGDIE